MKTGRESTAASDRRHESRRRFRTIALGGLVVLGCLMPRSGLGLSDPPANPKAILTAGKAALEDGLYDVAQKQFELYLNKTGGMTKTNEAAIVLLLRSMYQQGKHAEILTLLKGKQWPDKGELGGTVRYWRALALYETGKTDEALAEVDDFEKDCAGSDYVSRVVRLRAWCCLKAGKTQRALAGFASFDQAFADSPEGPANLLDWGKALLAADRLEEARQVLERLSKHAAAGNLLNDGAYWLGQVLLREQKWDEAFAILAPLSTNENVREDLGVAAMLGVGKICEVRTNVAEAVAAFSNGLARARSPELKQEGAYNLGRIYLENGRLDEGIPLLKSFISAAPADPQAAGAQLKLAQALLDHARGPEAVNEFQYYLETFTNSAGQAQARFGRGWALLGIGRHAEAAAEFMKAYGLFTDPGRKERCLFKGGDAYFANSQFNLAAETYEQILHEFPDSRLLTNAFFQLAESLTRADDSRKMEKKFLDLIGKYPNASFAEEAVLRLGEIRRSQNRSQEALENFNTVINVYSNGNFRGLALHSRGMVYYHLLRFGEARDDFEQVVRAYTNAPCAEQAFYMRGLCDYGMGKDEQAKALCHEFIKRYPASRWAPDVMFWIATYDFNQGNYEPAEKGSLQIVEKYHDSSLADSALLLAGRAAGKRQEYVRANELFTRLIKEYPGSPRLADARFAQADAMIELAKYPAAILIYEKIIIEHPDSELVPAAWCLKGDCQFKLGGEDPKRYNEAIESCRVVVNSSGAGPELVMQANYTIGRCMEKLGRPTEAVEQYYVKVIVPFMEERGKGIWHSETCKLWFTKAVLTAADILQARKEWTRAVNLLERAVEADVPAAADIKERIKKIKSEHWWNFINSSQ